MLKMKRTRAEAKKMMIRSRTQKARVFALILLCCLVTQNCDPHGCTFATALPHSAVKEGSERIRPAKLPELSESNRKNFRSTPKKRDIDSESVQVISPSEKQDENGANVSTDKLQKTKDLATGRKIGQDSFSKTKLVLQRLFNRLDAMDKMIFRNTLPLLGVTSIAPILQSNDLFWVNQLGDTLAVSAQSAANTLYQFSFGLISFIPSVTATLVSKSFAKNDLEQTESTLTSALLFGFTTSFIISMMIFANPSRYLRSVLKDENPALGLSMKYMRIRSLSLVPQMITFVCFGAFRGMLDYDKSIKLALIASGFDILLRPVLIHTFRLGILGSATSSLLCDSFTAIAYMKLLKNKGFFAKDKFKLPSWSEVTPMLKGSTLQARSFAMHLTNLVVARKIQSFDNSGVFPAAFSLAMQTFFTGGILIYAMAMATQTLYPNAVGKCKEKDKESYSKILVRRLLGRGFWAGNIITLFQAVIFPLILRTTPIQKVREAAFFPVMISIAFQGINAIVCVGEAIMVGSGMFSSASLVLIAASIGYIGCLRLLPQSWGINGVSASFGIFNILRLLGLAFYLPSVLNQQRLTSSPVKES